MLQILIVLASIHFSLIWKTSFLEFGNISSSVPSMSTASEAPSHACYKTTMQSFITSQSCKPLLFHPHSIQWRPTGLPLSDTSFLTVINEIFTIIPNPTKPFLFVDDINIHFESNNLHRAHHRTTLCLNLPKPRRSVSVKVRSTPAPL